jgi:hypothetical protein
MTEDYLGEMLELMKGMLVVRCEFLHAYGSFEYVAYSPRFLEVEQGAMVPEYHITFKMGRFAPHMATFSHESEKYSFKRRLLI